MTNDDALRVGVVIASAGRHEILSRTLDHVLALDWTELVVVVSVPDEESRPSQATSERLLVVEGVRGAAAQRNAGIAALPAGTDVVFFFDDDTVPRADYVSRAVALLDERPDIVAVTGHVAADGAPSRREISVDEALRILEFSDRGADWVDTSWKQLYGCNFAVRHRILTVERFDERLPLYSWLEDHDLARRVLAHGLIARFGGSVAVHLGASSGGREAHRRFGYSQLINPYYLWRKGSFPLGLALTEAGRPALMNAARSLSRDQGPWRRRRLRGNIAALVAILRGHGRPEDIIGMDS